MFVHKYLYWSIFSVIDVIFLIWWIFILSKKHKMKKIYVTSEQLNEIIDSNLMLSSDPIPEFDKGLISVTEPTTLKNKKANSPLSEGMEFIG